MEKKTVLAVILSLIILLVWYRFFVPKISPPVSTPVTPLSKPLGEKSAQEIPLARGGEIPFQLGETRIVFNTAGAGMKEWVIKEKNNEVNLVLDSEIENLFFSTLPEINYEAIEKQEGKIIFRGTTAEGIRVNKSYEFERNNYFGYLDLEFDNPTNTEKKINGSLLTLGPGLGTDEKGKKDNLRSLRVLGYQNKMVQKLKFNTYGGDWSWFAIGNRYFLAALLPESKIDRVVVEKFGKPAIPVVKIDKELVLPPKSKTKVRFRFYLGPKKYDDLKSYRVGLENAVDFGLFAPISKSALWTLKRLYGLVKNYGLAIVIMTIFLQILLFPLTKKSFQASLAMKKVQPLINELKEKYKSDPKRFQAELFHLYRAQKANPFSGCLPMVLQIPIFWALFTTLQNAYELRGAGFILWIKDLSHHDPYYVLPVSMGAVMFIQQKMSTVATDPTQKQMMYMMPIIFTFMFLRFPSGLVLYWLTSSLVGLLVQLYLMKRA